MMYGNIRQLEEGKLRIEGGLYDVTDGKVSFFGFS
jgi:hypothetical protein